MANDFSNPLAQNELTYDFSGFDIDMNDLWERSANRGAEVDVVWDEETQSYYRSTTEAHSQMDLALSGKTVEDITSVDYSEPVYFVGGFSKELGEVQEKYTLNEDGTMALRKGFMTESELREAWDADEGMGYFKKANPDMTFDSYMGMVKDGTQRWHDGGGTVDQDSFYAELAADHGVQTVYQNSDGDVFNFSGGGYVKSHKVDDHMSPGDWMKTVMTAAVTAGAAAALAPTLAGAIGVNQATAKALINTAISIAQDGEVNLGDAFALAGANIPGVGALDEITDVSQAVIDDAIGAVVGEILDQDNYGNEGNKPVFTPTEADITGETEQDEETDEFNTEFGVDVDITMPRFPMDPDANQDGTPGGGGGGTDGETDETGGAEAGGEEADENGGEEIEGIADPEDPFWTYENGVWTNGYETIYGPGNEGDTMTNEEMGEAWESGDYTWTEFPEGQDNNIGDGEEPVGEGEDNTGEEEEEGGSLPNITLGGGSGGGAGGTGGGGGAGGTGGTGGSGDGAGGGTPGTGGGSGGGSGTGTGPGTGPGQGPGEGGDGNGDGGEGMLRGGGGGSSFTFSELFPYTQITHYQEKALKPVKNRIQQARGLMNDIFGDS